MTDSHRDLRDTVYSFVQNLDTVEYNGPESLVSVYHKKGIEGLLPIAIENSELMNLLRESDSPNLFGSNYQAYLDTLIKVEEHSKRVMGHSHSAPIVTDYNPS